VLNEAVAAGELPSTLDRRASTDVLVMLGLACFRASLHDGVSPGQIRDRLRSQITLVTQGWRGPC